MGGIHQRRATAHLDAHGQNIAQFLTRCPRFHQGFDVEVDARLAMLADGDGSFTRALGLGYETGSFGGYRSSRYALIVKDGVVTQLNLESEDSFGASSAEAILELL